MEKVGVNCCIAKGVMDDKSIGLPSFVASANRSVIIATNVLSRGVCIPANIVINFDIPGQHTFFFDRSNRVGRFGQDGLVISLCNQNSVRLLESHVEKLALQITEL